MSLPQITSYTGWLWGRHYDKATTTTRDTPKRVGWWDLNTQVHWHSGYPQKSSWGVPTVSDELYSCLDEHPSVEFKIRMEPGMEIECQDQPDDVSSAWKIWPQLRRYDLTWNKPWQLSWWPTNAWTQYTASAWDIPHPWDKLLACHSGQRQTHCRASQSA